MDRRGRWAILALSAAAHAGLVTAWLLTRVDAVPTELPLINVQLTRLRPPKVPVAETPPPKAAVATPPEVRPVAPVETAAAPQPASPAPERQLSDEELLAGFQPNAAQVRNAPMPRGSWAAIGPARRAKCKPPPGYPGPPLPCPGHALDDPDPQHAADEAFEDSPFGGEGRRKLTLKGYREGTANYPRVRCAILHRQC